MEAAKPEPLSDGALSAVMARLDDDGREEPVAPPPEMDAETLHLIPEPLRGYLEGGLDALPWRTRGIGVREAMLDLGDPGVRTSLVRIAPGGRILAHTHCELERTIVLKGAYTDNTGRYARGDVGVATAELDHTPVAERDQECICLILVEGGLRFTGRFSRLLNPLVQR